MPHPNRILASLPPASLAAIKPYLNIVELKHTAVLVQALGSVEHVYFPHSEVISLVVELQEGDMIDDLRHGRQRRRPGRLLRA